MEEKTESRITTPLTPFAEWLALMARMVDDVMRNNP